LSTNSNSLSPWSIAARKTRSLLNGSRASAFSPHRDPVIIGAPKVNWIGPVVPVLKTIAISRFSSQTLLPMFATHNTDDLTVLHDLLASGTITPVIDRTYPLAETAHALRYLETRHARGKVVITI
jgi:NADPH:quinone reductase-like Zn-dependent oxidoreductase